MGASQPERVQGMIALLQRVTNGSVAVQGKQIAAIDRGLVVLVCAERGDDQASSDRLVERVLSCRIFPDRENKMNLSVADVEGGLLLVPQFTLAADTRKGTRPGFARAAAPDQGRLLFKHFVSRACARHPDVAAGLFGADMQVSLTNDGPVTIWLQVAP
jgi:D-tyrosyl-tRNA(Tyr) deacylase